MHPGWLDPLLRNSIEIYFGVISLTAFPWWKLFVRSYLRSNKEMVEMIDFLGLCQLWIISPASLTFSLLAAGLLTWIVAPLCFALEATVLILLYRDGPDRLGARPYVYTLTLRLLPLLFFCFKIIIDKHFP